MTPEQLNEIEKLAEAATPGPWLDDVGVDVERPPFYGNWYAEWYACAPGHESKHFDTDGEPTIGTPAQKQAEADARFICVMRRCALPLVKALREARVERDEAHRERADWMHSLDRSKADIITLMRERDEARAEVERLRDEVALLKRHLSGAWQDRDRAEAALKEGDR